MGKKSKIGKQRRDRFYHLAKETGFRSRAAFKLIQLNRKFKFLERSKVLIDLCAAPGGWMQVAKQNMPVSSLVIGVDMYPMKSVPGCLTLLEDITTDKCRISLQKELKTWKADVVLHDGAPNLGKNWLHDAYNQNILTLSALKLASSFLKKGGWFVSKVFRSKDYNALMWVFKKMFKKVHATKPPASRNESAEIFVVCEHYLAPAKIEDSFWNPNYVFKELEAEPRITFKDLIKSAENDMSVLHTKVPASLFLASDSPASLCQNAYEIVIDTDEIKNHPKTTEEIKRLCEEFGNLNKKDLRTVFAWWKEFQTDQNKVDEEEKPASEGKSDVVQNAENKIVDELDEEEAELQEVEKMVEELEAEKKRENKRKRKKVNKERMKLVQKLSLNMRHKDDLGPTDEGELDVFQLSRITSENQLKKLADQKPDIMAESDDEEEPGRKPKKMKYDTEKSQLDDSGLFYRSDESEPEGSDDDIDSEVEGLGLNDSNEKSTTPVKVKKRVTFAEPENLERTNADEPEPSHPLITDLDYRNVRDKRISKAQLWFDKNVFDGVESEDDEDFELEKMAAVIKSQGGRIAGDNDSSSVSKEDDGETSNDSSESEDDEKENNGESGNTQKAKVSKGKAKNTVDFGDNFNEWDVNDTTVAAERKRQKKERKTLDVEGLALGAMMVNSGKTKRDIIDAGWNRFAFNDENLPEWFVEDEKKHMRKEVPVPKELIDEYTKSREELNVRPIRRVVEAKARKKRRATRKLEKLKKKLENVMDNPDITEAEKARDAKQMYKKLNNRKPEVKYIVAKRHTASKRVRRPKGVSGPFKVVDPRMKKDLRGKISKETKHKSKKAVNKIKKSYKPKRSKR
ncbi:hypothetical protein V9T40_011071 [Parthenolecanium corni]|uniref:Putative rRNA methyltransferase n=1 Tax=Parthenolecanium corni TaxID=536013 RepID=A0AAN9XZ74_9HEMI